MQFTSERINATSGAVDPFYLSEAYMYSDLDHDQHGMKIEVPKSFSSIFPKKDGKCSEMEFAGMAKPNIATTNYDLDKESEVLIVDNGATTTLSNTLFNMNNVQ